MSKLERPRKERSPVIIHCPKCGEQGRIDEYEPRKSNKNRKEYCIVHGELNYEWGKRFDTKVQARERCYIVKPSHRAQVIARLGQLTNV